MKCQQAEKLIVNLPQVDLDETTRHDLDFHLSRCPKCVNFKKNYEVLLKRMNDAKILAPSEVLERRTKMLCHKEILERNRAVVLADQNQTF